MASPFRKTKRAISLGPPIGQSPRGKLSANPHPPRLYFFSPSRVAKPAFVRGGLPSGTGFQPVKPTGWKPVPRGNDRAPASYPELAPLRKQWALDSIWAWSGKLVTLMFAGL